MAERMFVEYVPVSDHEDGTLKEDEVLTRSYPSDIDLPSLVDALITIHGPLHSLYCFVAEEEG